jgi:hypothetical protein
MANKIPSNSHASDHLNATFIFIRSHPTTAFSCGTRSAFKLKEQGYLRNMLSRRQLQGFVGLRACDHRAADSIPINPHRLLPSQKCHVTQRTYMGTPRA